LFSQGANFDPVDTFLPATLAMGIFACGLGFLDALALAFFHYISLEFRKAAQDIKQQFGERIMVVSVERQIFWFFDV